MKRRLIVLVALSAVLLGGCSSWTHDSSRESAGPPVVLSPTVQQTLTSRDQLVKDLQVLRATDWNQQPMFDLARTSPYADYSSLSAQQERGIKAEVLGVQVSQQWMQARALVVYSAPRISGNWLGVAIFEASQGEVTQIATGLVGADQGLNLNTVIFKPTVMGADIYLQAQGDPIPGAWVIHKKMADRSYSYLPDGVSWIGASLSVAGPDLIDAEHVGPQQVPQNGVVAIQGQQLTSAD